MRSMARSRLEIGGAGDRPGLRRPGNWPECSLLGLLSRETLAALRVLGRRREYANGEVIVAQGDETSFVCILVRGVAKITVVSADGTESLLAIRVAGEALTEFAMIDGRPRSATVTAATAAFVQTISATDFHAFLDTHIDAHRALQRSLAGKLRAEVDSRIAVNGPVRVRLARLLLNLVDMYGYDVPGGTAIDVPLSQAELGSLIAVSEVSVNKNLAEMRRETMVEIPGHRRYVVRDLAGLRKIAGKVDATG
jgi:CRP-like cAMP-binding protein